ncbi:MAG TPA: ethylbenzene dehydrogenase-related protein [Candidatus Deferrimicrobium sp.]|nr:ethylbenzene dehydrogenase-related protein [Candidatus Deferrimicrobium sp.]
MQKIIPILAILPLALWMACGGDDKGTNGTNGTKPVRVIADTTVAAPTLSSADEAVWTSVASYKVPVAQGNAPKLSTGKATAVPPEIQVQSIKKTGNLYLRVRWADPTFDAFPDHYRVDSIRFVLNGPDELRSSHRVCPIACEDQAFVLFDGLTGGGYDVWQWSVLSTGAGGLGKGNTFVTNLSADAKGTAADTSPVTANDQIGWWPTYAHEDTSEFNGYILHWADVVHWSNDTLDTMFDTTVISPSETIFDTFFVFFYNTAGWDTLNNQKIPGWIVDSGFASQPDDSLGSRWDIRTVSTYDSTVFQYRVVFSGKLNTGYPDDLDLSTKDSVKVKVGVYDNQAEFETASNKRGFSNEFWIILK